MNIKSIIAKFQRNQRLIPVIDLNQHKMLAEMRRWQIEESLLRRISADAKEQDVIGIAEQPVFGDKKLIISLTSYGRRLYDVCYTIESIMRQTVRSNKIVLWIDEADRNNIPNSLKALTHCGLEIIVTPENIRSYKKLYHSLLKYPEDVIVTVDDDLIYEFDLLERLVGAYRETPDAICAARCHRVRFDSEGNLLPYNQWKWHYRNPSISGLNFLTGVGGVLYPPHSLAQEVTDMDTFTTLAPTADDVWFYFMAIKNRTLIRKIATRNPGGDDYMENYAFHDEGLMQVNTKGECLNDVQIRAVADHYKLNDLLKTLK